MIIENIVSINGEDGMLCDAIGNEKGIIITVPKDIEWQDYEIELEKCKDWKSNINFKVSNFPKGIDKGDKCYVVHRGIIKGWQPIVGFETKDFECTTTARAWTGKFIVRSGKFHYMEKEVPMKGFQGFRYTDCKF
ncbi:hypothetical protein EZS27_010879 [termite gut metagenome]|uniref:Uncharacterized protein n=1 Tax=termite gut metagenome TaxID=433724 RepID=A0A5J4S669_9ZZZZ